jgi:N-acetylglucosamine-6-sulfatase
VRARRYARQGVDGAYDHVMTLEESYRNACRNLMSVDESVGGIFEELERTRLLDNTLVVFMGDNGFMWGEHGLIDKRAMYEPSIRIPLAVHCPELCAGGRKVPQMALNLDIAPTFLEAAGLRVPAGMHGRSLLPVLRDGAALLRDSLLVEHFVEKMVPTVPDWQAVRTDACKYIHYPTLKNMDELYDLKTDPHEIRNLASDAGYSEPLARMQTELSRHLRETDDPRLRLGFL